MKERGIMVKAVSMSGLAEEAGFAYKIYPRLLADRRRPA